MIRHNFTNMYGLLKQLSSYCYLSLELKQKSTNSSWHIRMRSSSSCFHLISAALSRLKRMRSNCSCVNFCPRDLLISMALSLLTRMRSNCSGFSFCCLYLLISKALSRLTRMRSLCSGVNRCCLFLLISKALSRLTRMRSFCSCVNCIPAGSFVPIVLYLCTSSLFCFIRLFEQRDEKLWTSVWNRLDGVNHRWRLPVLIGGYI
jgi:hypothetical protein